MAELVHGEKEHSDWKSSSFLVAQTHKYPGPIEGQHRKSCIELMSFKHLESWVNIAILEFFITAGRLLT